LVTQAEVDAGAVLNSVSVTATPPGGPVLPPKESNVTTPVGANPSLSIAKTATYKFNNYTYTTQ
jgi:hypothetical protein